MLIVLLYIERTCINSFLVITSAPKIKADHVDYGSLINRPRPECQRKSIKNLKWPYHAILTTLLESSGQTLSDFFL